VADHCLRLASRL